MTAGVAPSRRESATAPALPSGQLDFFPLADSAWSVYSEGLRYHRSRLSQDGKRWPYLRPYLAAVVQRFERLCAGESEADVGPWPTYPDEPGVVPSAGVVTPAERCHGSKT